jgi:hypothetical protein
LRDRKGRRGGGAEDDRKGYTGGPLNTLVYLCMVYEVQKKGRKSPLSYTETDKGPSLQRHVDRVSTMLRGEGDIGIHPEPAHTGTPSRPRRSSFSVADMCTR